ncbi:MAG: hypothetical protein KTR33_16185 [Gammaproteobacteria bacterium]|nr:hypothetical protein [Gammaproteobacteria bacterium]
MLRETLTTGYRSRAVLAMTAPINNNLRNFSQTPVRPKTDPGKSLGAREIQENADANLATDRIGGESGNAVAAVGQQNLDWFSDLDAGSKLPIVASDRYKGRSMDDIVSDIQQYLRFNQA